MHLMPCAYIALLFCLFCFLFEMWSVVLCVRARFVQGMVWSTSCICIDGFVCVHECARVLFVSVLFRVCARRVQGRHLASAHRVIGLCADLCT